MRVDASKPGKVGAAETRPKDSDVVEVTAPGASDPTGPVSPEAAASVGSATPASATPPTDQTGRAPDTASTDGGQLSGLLGRLGIPGLLLGCFLYGLALNATPCVLPVLSIKVLGFVQQAHESRSRTLILGLTFGAGVMLFFVILGFLAAAGKNILQYPAAVIALGAVVMALALSMLGVYTLQAPNAATKLEASIQREGALSSFGKGALAPVLGFACTGPLLAGAFGWATQQPPRIAVFAFLSAGLGMATPYMLLGANPNWLSFLPKPGPWMITFERIMGFLLLGMVIWLLHPLITQIGAEGLEWTFLFLVAIAMACWMLGKVDMSMSAQRRWKYRGGATAIVVLALALVYGWAYPLDEAKARVLAERLASSTPNDDWSTGIPWRRWSPDSVRDAVLAGNTVFVDFTAAYCTNCKINKKKATETADARVKMKALGVIPFQADYTNEDEVIFAELQKHSRAGVPLNLLYSAGKPDNPIVFPPLFTKKHLLQTLDEAGPSRTASLSAERS